MKNLNVINVDFFDAIFVAGVSVSVIEADAMEIVSR